MATTTTNYGFDVPTSSDLVKNGATQIALLGQDLDTFLFRPFTRNAVINGGMDIWQRGTSFTSGGSAAYCADRFNYWRAASAAGMTVTRQTSTQTGFQYALRVARDSGNTGTGILYLQNNLESSDSYRFAGQTATLSFYAKAGANYSSASSVLNVLWQSGTGTDQTILNGFTGATSLANTTATLTTSWQRFTYTAAVSSTATQLGFQLYYTPVGTAGAADNFEITGVQVEVGSQVSPFIRAGGGLVQQELAACQRYYFRTKVNEAVAPYGSAFSTTGVRTVIPLPVTMRVAPTSIDVGNTLYALDGQNAYALSSLTVATSATNFLSIDATVSGATQYRPYYWDADSVGYLGFNAEL